MKNFKLIISIMLSFAMFLVAFGCISPTPNPGPNPGPDPTTITVVWNVNGGTGSKADWSGSDVKDFAVGNVPGGDGLSREGYEFVGWSLTKTDSVALEATAIVGLVEDGVTEFFAVWEYAYMGTPTKAPYTIFNSDGSVVTGQVVNSANQNWETTGVESDMFRAINIAGANATNQNPMYVKDANGLEVFRRIGQTTWYMYDGLNYVGTASAAEAAEWGKTRTQSLVLNGRGTAYEYLGESRMPTQYETPLSEIRGFELFSGGYNYMFSKGGTLTGGQWSMGYGYASAYVRLSEATYKPTADGDGWNAYIFFNGIGNGNSDLGLIGNLIGDSVKWRPVRNCSADDHKNDPETYGTSFSVLSTTPVTEMKLFNEETGEWSGADDLFFEGISHKDGFYFTMTNMRTGVVTTINEDHTDMHKGAEQYFSWLIAASYCPVVGKVWNPQSGAALRNIVFEDLRVARYVAGYNTAQHYTESDDTIFYELYPGSEAMAYGYAQCAYNSSWVFDTYKTDGISEYGKAYKKGDKFLSMSCFYDGDRKHK